jgi:hypothetical protein
MRITKLILGWILVLAFFSVILAMIVIKAGRWSIAVIGGSVGLTAMLVVGINLIVENS